MTLLDYPQKVAAIIFTSGCDMRCPFCYNPNLVLPELIKKSTFLPENNLFNFLNRRKKYLDGVVITGGEPTIQKDIINICQKIKKLGYALKLDTNGLLPRILADLIAKKLVDYLAMDLKGPLEKYSDFCGAQIDPNKIKASITLIKHSQIDYEFRSTLVKGWHTKADIKKMARLVNGAKKYFLQNFNWQDGLVGRDFKGESFSHKEMEEFQRIASGFVKECGIR